MDFLQAFLMADFLGQPAWVWAILIGIVVTLLGLDLGVLHKDDRKIGVRESLLLSAGYISVALFLVGIIGKIPAVISLTVTFSLIAGAVWVSLWKTRGRPAVAESS